MGNYGHAMPSDWRNALGLLISNMERGKNVILWLV